MWLWKTLGTSVGKKLMMAVTGLFFCSFLIVHLIGNLMLYGGKELFNAYAARLHSLGPAIYFAEGLMLILGVIHILTGILLFIQNISARPIRYQVNKSGGGRTIGSATMPYSGLFILIFLVFHLIKFHFGELQTRTIYDIVNIAFADPYIVVFYVFSMIILSVHISHGFQSSFQTLGISHDKYTPGIKTAGFLFCIFVVAGFGFIPVWISFFS